MHCKIILSDLKQAKCIVLTSKNGVKSFFENLQESNILKNELNGIKFAVIGKGTAKELEKQGVKVDIMPPQATSDSLAEELKKNYKKSDNIWYIRPAKVGDSIKNEMRDYSIFEYIMYENKPVDFEVGELFNDKYDNLIVFTCASSAQRFFDKIKGTSYFKGTNQLPQFIAIGPKTYKKLRALGITPENIRMPEEATYQSIVELIEKN